MKTQSICCRTVRAALFTMVICAVGNVAFAQNQPPQPSGDPAPNDDTKPGATGDAAGEPPPASPPANPPASSPKNTDSPGTETPAPNADSPDNAPSADSPRGPGADSAPSSPDSGASPVPADVAGPAPQVPDAAASPGAASPARGGETGQANAQSNSGQSSAGQDAGTPATDVTFTLEEDEEAVLESPGEVIVVTGSRIRTDPLSNPAPVRQLGREELDRTGLTSVADILQRLPVSGGGLNTKFNSSGNFGFPPDGGGIGAGAAQADLRYLGPKRVLVLVDGVRWVNGSSASGVAAATDLNTIPVGIVERIEVLEDGASPIYGSDAIAGVVNIITRKDWNGIIANAYVGGYNAGDGITQQYDVSWGNKIDRLSISFGASYVDQGRISADDREISRYALPGVSECTPSCSAGTPQGRFVFTDPNTGQELDLTINEGVDGVPFYNAGDSGRGSDDFNTFDTVDRFNFAPYNLMLTPSQRLGIFTNVEYKLLPKLTVHARALFNNRKSVNQAAPEPLFIGPDAGAGNLLDDVSIHESNPYNPFGFTLDAETNPYFIGRRPLEAGPRIFRQNVNTWYVSGGLRGDFQALGTRFYWETSAAYSINRADQLKSGAFNAAKLAKALGPLDECEADPECVPFNIFGGQGSDGRGTITKEMLDYVTFVQKDISEQELFDVVANVSADLFRLPSGPLSFAAGVEYREQSGFFQPDAVVVAGDTAGTPASPTSGSFVASEAYAETRVPILAKVPGANLLDLGGAVRLSNYSTFGTEATFKAGARWRPHKDFLLRGNYARGFRAPGIGELYGTETQFDQTIEDPCSDMLGLAGGAPAPQEIVDNCEQLNVPGDGSYVQFNPQIGVTTGGNIDLEPETSDSYTVSFVYSPSWLRRSPWVDNLDLEATFYQIEIAGAISAIDAQVQLDSCVRNPDDPVLCGGIQRTPTGVINSFDNQLRNIGGITTSGLDFTLGYLMPELAVGRFRATSSTSYLLNYTETIPSADGFQDISREGTVIGDLERAFPRFKSSLTIDWFQGDWRASLTTRYIHSLVEPCRGLTGYPGLCSDPNMEDDTLSTNVLQPTVYSDVQVIWAPMANDRQFELTVGINNILNQDPPVCYSCSLNGFAGSVYDVPGVFGYVKAGYRIW